MKLSALHIGSLWSVFLITCVWWRVHCLGLGMGTQRVGAKAWGSLAVAHGWECTPFTQAWAGMTRGMLGRAAALAGPGITWIPLLLWLRSSSRAGRSMQGRAGMATVAACMCAWLGLIHLVRYARVAHAWWGGQEHGWDPSGHIFLVGCQLAALLHVRYPSLTPAHAQEREGQQAGAASPRLTGHGQSGSQSPAAAAPSSAVEGRGMVRCRSKASLGSQQRGSPAERTPVEEESKGQEQASPACDAGSYTPLPPSFLVLDAFLWCVTGSTASFYHAGSEVYASYLLCLPIMACAWWHGRRPREGAALRALWVRATLLWCCGALLGLGMAVTGGLGGRKGYGVVLLTLLECLHDLATVAGAWWAIKQAAG